AVLQARQHERGIGAAREQIEELAPKMRIAVLVERDVVDIRQRDAGLLQAISDRLRGKASPMLEPAKTFFLGGRDQLAVLDEGGRRIAVKGVEAEDDHRTR